MSYLRPTFAFLQPAISPSETTTVTTTLDYVVLAADDFVLVDPVLSPRTVTLPAANVSANRQVVVKHASTSANGVSVVASGGGLIDGQQTWVLGSRSALSLACDGVAWHVV